MLDYKQLNTASLHEAALRYAASGIPVFPCFENKKPRTTHGFKDASTDPTQINAWWREFPNASIGSPTGGNSFVLDVDLPDGPEALAKLEQEYGSLPHTLEQMTGSGGRHLFFKLPEGVQIKNSAGKIGKGLDSRGIGGYVILPPSPHPSGQRYQWTGKGILHAAPEWLLQRILGTKTKRRSSSLPDNFDDAPETAKKHLIAIASAREGERNDTLNRESFAIGQLVGCGHFTMRDVISFVYTAAKISGLGPKEYFRTITSGIRAGKDHPKAEPPGVKKNIRELNVFPWPLASDAMFQGFAGEFIRFATQGSEADPIAVLFTFLSRFGVEVGRDAYISAGERQHPRVNAVLVGQSSKARKGTSYIPVRELFLLDDNIWNLAQVSPGPLSSGEGLIFAVRDERSEYVVDRSKGEGKLVVVDLGVEDKRLFVIDQEFAGALSCSKRDGNTISSIIRSMFDGHKVEPLTKTSKTTATDPHVAIVTHITTHELNSKMDAVEAFNGFANRFLWVCVRRPQLIAFPKTLDEARLANFRQRLLNILRHSAEIGEVCFASEAKELWAEVYPTLSKDRPGLPGAIMSRAETITLRLSLLYALLDCSPRISIAHLQAALACWDYCEQSTMFIFGEVEADSTERRIIDALHEVGEMDSRALYDVFSRNITKRHLEQALSSLVSSSQIVVEKRKTGTRGRPKNIYSLYEKNELNENNRAPSRE